MPRATLRAAVPFAVALAAALAGCVATGPAPLSREQGEQILAELREIRRSLDQPTRGREEREADKVVRVRATGAAAVLGRADAPVTIVEYTDFQCPFCRRFHDRTWPELRQNYVDTGRVRFVVRDLPLSFHEQAEPAAVAARCAAAQGRYWPARDALFALPGELAPERIRSTVLATGVDAAAFDACVRDPATLAAVRADAEEAAAAGVSGTPSFVVGRIDGGVLVGTMISGAQPYASFAQRIDALLPPADRRGVSAPPAAR
jgi:protein-disulfide isomerase